MKGAKDQKVRKKELLESCALPSKMTNQSYKDVKVCYDDVFDGDRSRLLECEGVEERISICRAGWRAFNSLEERPMQVIVV